MKLGKIALAVASLAAAPAAFALTPGQVAGATQLWITGASAPTNSVFQGFMTLCQGMVYKDSSNPAITLTNPGVLDVHMYIESTGLEPGKGSGDRVAYACTVDTVDDRAGSLENTKLVVYHTVQGGSFNAYSPALKLVGDTNANLPATLDRITEVADLGAAGQCAVGAATNTNILVSGENNVIPRYNGCQRTTVTLGTPSTAATVNRTGDTAPTTSVGGFSDTEYVINKLNLGVSTDLGTIGSEVNTNIGQAFGVGASYPLYYQLQKNDIAAGDLLAGCDNGYNGGSVNQPNITVACQPNLPAQTYSTVANFASSAGVDAALFGGAVGGKVNFARRAITSGTQSASNLRFLSAPCARGDAGGEQTPTRAVHSTATLTVTEQSGTGGVKAALNTATGAGEFGLGVVSMENVPAPVLTGTPADRWAFVKLDSVSPNSDTKQRRNAIKGNYTFWYELVAFTNGDATLPAQGAELMTAINTSLSNPNLTDLTGLFLTPLSGADATVFSNVGKGTRFGNSCQPISQ